MFFDAIHALFVSIFKTLVNFERYISSSFFKNLPDILVPMIWFSQEANMTSEMASQLGILVKAVDYGRWVLLGVSAVGGLFILVGLVLQSRGCFSYSDERLLR